MVCRDFILPEPASYVFFYAIFNLRNLLYIIFNTVTGTDDRVTISMDVTNRREYRTGIVTIKTELNNLMHAELVHKVIALFDKEEQDG